MLGFWGLIRTDNNDVVVNSAESARHRKWNGASTHDHQRVTRMLNFLMECGRYRLASNIEQAMQTQRLANNQGENKYWAEAIGRTVGAPRAPVARPVPSPPLSPTPVSTSPPKPALTPRVHSYTDYVKAFPYDQCQQRPKIEFYRSGVPEFVFTNFYQPNQPIQIGNELWPTTEHYYQACKFTPGSLQWRHIQSLPNADAVYDYMYPNRPDDFTPIDTHIKGKDWGKKRDEVMMTALRAKARHVPEFRQALLNSGDKILFEVSPKDKYWGTAKNKEGVSGKNVLGAMLMQVRDELKAGHFDRN